MKTENRPGRSSGPHPLKKQLLNRPGLLFSGGRWVKSMSVCFQEGFGADYFTLFHAAFSLI